MTTTQGEHAQTEAQRRAKIIRDWCADCRIPLPSDDECARLVAALTAQPAAPQGGAYAELPDDFPKTVAELEFLLDVARNCGQHMERADRLAASHGQAPAGAAREPTAFIHWPIDGPPRLVWYSQKALNDAILKTYEGHQPDVKLYTAQAAPAAGAVAVPRETLVAWRQWCAQSMSHAIEHEISDLLSAAPTPAAQADRGVQEDAPDPLQGAANWLAEAHGQFSPVVLSGCLMIGYNRAKRLHDAALAARKQGGKHD